MAQTLTTAFRTWVATRIGPLTTHFTPPASCLTINYTPGPNIADVPVLNAQTSVGAAITETAIADGATAETTTANAYLGETTRSECYPSNLLPYAQVGLIINPTIGYYSPAICPSSYTPACPDNRDLVDSNESASMCCPIGYTCTNLPTGFSLDLPILCQSTAFSADILTDPPLGLEPNRIVTITALGIRIRWQESDESVLGLTTATTPTTTAPPVAEPEDTLSEPTGLGTSAKIVIGVVVPVVVVAVLGLAWFGYRRRKRGGVATVMELEGNNIAEMGAEPPKYELAGDSSPVEADSRAVGEGRGEVLVGGVAVKGGGVRGGVGAEGDTGVLPGGIDAGDDPEPGAGDEGMRFLQGEL